MVKRRMAGIGAPFLMFVLSLVLSVFSKAPQANEKDCHQKGKNTPGKDEAILKRNGTSLADGNYAQLFREGDFGTLLRVFYFPNAEMVVRAACTLEGDDDANEMDSDLRDNGAELRWRLTNAHESRTCCHPLNAHSKWKVDMDWDFDPIDKTRNSAGKVFFGTAGSPIKTVSTFFTDRCGSPLNVTKTTTTTFVVRWVRTPGMGATVGLEDVSVKVTTGETGQPTNTADGQLEGKGNMPSDRRSVVPELKRGENYKAATFLEVEHKARVIAEATINAKVGGDVFVNKQTFHLNDMGHCDGTVNQNVSQNTN